MRTIKLRGKEYKTGKWIYFNIYVENPFEHVPLKNCIKHYDGIKWLGIKPYDYVYGWWYYKSDDPDNYVMNNYTLIIK